MKDSDAAVVLALCAAFDQRTIGRMDASAWGRVLGDIDLQDALAAVDAWYGEWRERIMPADVRSGGTVIRRRRAGQERIAEREQQIAAENGGNDLTTARPLRALLAGTPLKPAPRDARWPERQVPVASKPPFTAAELAAAKAELDRAGNGRHRNVPSDLRSPSEDSTRSEARL